MFRQHFDKLSVTSTQTKSCQPELVEGGLNKNLKFYYHN